MTQCFEDFLEKVDEIGGTFTERVKQFVLPKADRHRLLICDNNLILEKDKNNNFTPYGCDLCLGVEPIQDRDGIPTLGKYSCLDAWQNGLQDQHLPREAMLNLWFCPQCRVPLMSLVPKFE